ncbi:MAG: hypothetical protein WBG92_20300 [Thiohalocapsa sp.]
MRWLATTLFIATLVLTSALLQADDRTRDSMADAMARMMEAMGFLGDDKPGGDLPRSPGSLAFPEMVPGMSQFGLNQFGLNPFLPQPWSSSFADPAQNFGLDQMFRQIPGMQQMPEVPGMPGWQRTALEGIWEGREGGLLIVQSPRFRLYSPHGGFIDGLIQQRGDRVAMYDPKNDRARPYEFAEHQGRLVLRDAEGQVYMYRRLWLEYREPGSAQQRRR